MPNNSWTYPPSSRLSISALLFFSFWLPPCVCLSSVTDREHAWLTRLVMRLLTQMASPALFYSLSLSYHTHTHTAETHTSWQQLPHLPLHEVQITPGLNISWRCSEEDKQKKAWQALHLSHLSSDSHQCQTLTLQTHKCKQSVHTIICSNNLLSFKHWNHFIFIL